jgi:hypothetical protein
MGGVVAVHELVSFDDGMAFADADRDPSDQRVADEYGHGEISALSFCCWFADTAPSPHAPPFQFDAESEGDKGVHSVSSTGGVLRAVRR